MQKLNLDAAENGRYSSLLQAYDLFGMTDLIGDTGSYTAFTTVDSDDCVAIHVIPGRFTVDEFFDMLDFLVVPEITDARPGEAVVEEYEWRLAA